MVEESPRDPDTDGHPERRVSGSERVKTAMQRGHAPVVANYCQLRGPSAPSPASGRYAPLRSDSRRRLVQLAIACAADEFFQTPMRVVIRHLDGRMFRKISGRG